MGLRVLVVEDEPDTAASYGLLLRLWGYDVRVCLTGEEGLRVAPGYLPHVVLLDVGLGGGVDGYQVAGRLRREAGLSNAVLVAVTGFGREADRQATSKAGCDYHFVKPVDLDELGGLLQSVEAGWDSRTAPAATPADAGRYGGGVTAPERESRPALAHGHPPA